jgi:hypothetical protein
VTYEDACYYLSKEIQPDGTLHSLGWYLSADPAVPERIVLDGEFSVKDLEAIVAYMKGPPK